MLNFQDLNARLLRGEEISFERYAGKVVLVVNTASKCGFTPQYAGLQALYRKYSEEGLVILGFPCNQFGQQEPGDARTIENSCLVNYGVSFPMFEKVEVKGKNTHPVFDWLTRRLPGVLGRTIRWNFTKFLVGRDGRPVKRFAPWTRPEEMEKTVRKVLRS